MTVDNFELVMTSCACPEQYDVFKDGEQVGYLRLRHGKFRADYPKCGKETVYVSFPKGDGIFEEDEREEEINKALEAISQAMQEKVDKELKK